MQQNQHEKTVGGPVDEDLRLEDVSANARDAVDEAVGLAVPGLVEGGGVQRTPLDQLADRRHRELVVHVGHVRPLIRPVVGAVSLRGKRGRWCYLIQG